MHLSKGCVVAMVVVAIAVQMVSAAGSAQDSEPGAFRPKFSHEYSVGGISRVGSRDAGLIGRANGGTGTSVKYDDGNLNYGRGLASVAVQGRSSITGGSEHVEVGLEAVYFFDFINADGDTDFRDLSDEGRDRTGRAVYLNEAFLGLKEEFDAGQLTIRAGNQRLRWSDSPSFGQSIAPVNPVAASRRYQPGNTAKDTIVALPMLFGELVTGNSGQCPVSISLASTQPNPKPQGHS